MRRTGTVAALVSIGLAALLAGCAQKQSVKFAAVLPLTGSSPATPEIAQSVQRGLELGFEHLQADPAISYQLEFEIRDSQGDPQQAAAIATELYGSSLALVGGLTTESALAMVESSKRAEKLLLSPTAIGDQLSGASRTTFYRLFPTATQQASAMANFAKERLEVAHLVILIEQDRAATEGLVEGLRSLFTQYGGEVAGEIAFASSDDLAAVVDQALSTLGEQNADTQATGIYLAASGSVTASIVSLLRERGYGLTEGKREWVMATSTLAHPAFIAQAGRAAEGVYLTAPLFDLESQDPPMPAFRAAYKEKYGEEPDLYAAHGYDALLVYGEALKKTVSLLPSEFQKGLRSLSAVQGTTGSIQFNESGDAQKFARVHVIRDAKLIDFQKWYQEAQEQLRQKREELLREMERMRLQGTGTSE